MLGFSRPDVGVSPGRPWRLFPPLLHRGGDDAAGVGVPLASLAVHARQQQQRQRKRARERWETARILISVESK